MLCIIIESVREHKDVSRESELILNEDINL